MKQALITGASSGLGAYLANQLAEGQWRVLGTGRRPAAETPLTPAVDYLQADLADAASTGLILDRLEKQAPDLVVHCATLYGDVKGGPPDLDDLTHLFRVNALAPYCLLNEIISAVPEDRFCTCVVVNSDAIYHVSRQTGAYAASKASLRVLTSALASSCKGRNASVATLLLGPLADPKKLEELRRVAERRGIEEAEVARLFLSRSNPFLVIDELIDLAACLRSVEYMASLGPAANGMLCKLDGGSSGALV